MRKVITGKSKDDTLKGTDRQDKIHGEGGDDRINGGGGHDHLYGDGGHDMFIFKSYQRADSDVIHDFHNGDAIGLQDSVFTSLKGSRLPTIFPLNFVEGTEATSSTHYIIYDRSTGHLFYDPDGDGAEQKHLVATIANHAKIEYDDIYIL